MAKEGKKPLTAEEAQEKLTKAKEKLVEAKDELKAFCKKNGVKSSEDHSNHEDEKIAKGYKKRKAEVDEAQTRVDKYLAAKKEAKKSGGSKKAKYNYPDDVKSSSDKKKFRAEVRAKAKRAGVSVDEFLADPAKYEKALEAKKKEKGEKAEKKEKKADKKEKSEKKAEKTEAPAESKPAKKKKKEAEAATADED